MEDIHTEEDIISIKEQRVIPSKDQSLVKKGKDVKPSESLAPKQKQFVTVSKTINKNQKVELSESESESDEEVPLPGKILKNYIETKLFAVVKQKKQQTENKPKIQKVEPPKNKESTLPKSTSGHVQTKPVTSTTNKNDEESESEEEPQIKEKKISTGI